MRATKYEIHKMVVLTTWANKCRSGQIFKVRRSSIPSSVWRKEKRILNNLLTVQIISLNKITTSHSLYHNSKLLKSPKFWCDEMLNSLWSVNHSFSNNFKNKITRRLKLSDYTHIQSETIWLYSHSAFYTFYHFAVHAAFFIHKFWDETP